MPLALELVARHLGNLHPAETWLVLLLAFGPFVVITLLVRRDRRRHTEDDDPLDPMDPMDPMDQRSP